MTVRGIAQTQAAPGLPDTWVDEDIDDHGAVQFQAVCADCSWCGVWHHSSDFDHVPDPDDPERFTTPEDQAFGNAKAEANNHECED
jgi:hypothetical protein